MTVLKLIMGDKWVQKHMFIGEFLVDVVERCHVAVLVFGVVDERALGDRFEKQTLLKRTRAFYCRLPLLRGALHVNENVVHWQVEKDGISELGDGEDALTDRSPGIKFGFLPRLVPVWLVLPLSVT